VLPNLRLALICGVSALALVCGAYWYGKLEGTVSCKAAQATAQLKHSAEVKATNDRIDSETPFNRDKSTSMRWLLKHGRE